MTGIESEIFSFQLVEIGSPVTKAIDRSCHRYIGTRRDQVIIGLVSYLFGGKIDIISFDI